MEFKEIKFAEGYNGITVEFKQLIKVEEVETFRTHIISTAETISKSFKSKLNIFREVFPDIYGFHGNLKKEIQIISIKIKGEDKNIIYISGKMPSQVGKGSIALNTGSIYLENDTFGIEGKLVNGIEAIEKEVEKYLNGNVGSKSGSLFGQLEAV